MTTTKTRKPPDAPALFAADVRREIRNAERVIADARKLGVGGTISDPARWLVRAMDGAKALDALGGDKGAARACAVGACAALYFAATGEGGA